MSLEEVKNIEDLYKAKTFGTIQFDFASATFIYQCVVVREAR